MKYKITIEKETPFAESNRSDYETVYEQTVEDLDVKALIAEILIHSK